ncbi:Alcohol dehydrogenase superfamily, zinc-type [Cordyceps fumosorosea ARSEF 2679]|uniref:Alcohol dehydrogenase superfamily, zinc-type n=1 Tax=Cordyceps fumosorosea (strain ARSEF 2679) TaxID=1081104 RepID=A0A167EL77_CORFA|nr:Alcohol dehydrogenase superfamily, zinc-type [Cordyceps fumosorosea ARSEF 2679]OAA44104.1 Alcohol dehydrogenase superfamily, zinc-type [Cordyceps fumosorosea ARSEF 2679]
MATILSTMKALILVKVNTIALNPADFKHINRLLTKGAIAGCDYASVIAKVGGDAATASWKVGDRVAGWVHGGLWQDRGSFAHVLDLNASTYGAYAATAILGLQEHLGLPWPNTITTTTTTTTTSEPILIYAASTSMGLFAMNLAKLTSRTVVATASPYNFDLVWRHGANAVFNYKSPTLAADIRAAYPSLR